MNQSRDIPQALDEASRQALRDYYNSSDAYLADLETHDSAYLEPYIRFVCRHAPPGGVLLDLGCGTGLSAWMLGERGYPVVGVDFSQLFLARGRQQRPGQPLLCADLLELPLADGSVDAVAGTNFIEHITDLPRCLAQCWRVLRPGGRLILCGPNLCSPFFPLADWLRLLVGGRGRPNFAESRAQAWHWFKTNLERGRSKLRHDEPQWLYRRPDLSERHVGGDADSTYLACPIDFERYFCALPNARILSLSTGESLKSRLLARALPRWSPFLGVVVEKKP